MTSTSARPVQAAVAAPIFRPLEFPRVFTARGRKAKRTIDILAAVILVTVAAPVFVLIAIVILLESGRPVFFRHDRIGRGSGRFRVWKFRTMVVNGDEILERHLLENPASALEWELTHKLKNDPRLTRTGRLLRRTSLDELPQLWNVLRGEMSMVGPRPIVAAEISKYGAGFHWYRQVRPGLTGLWQVSGRNDTTYRRRIELDTHYIRNWSPRLDIAVLLKTVLVVLIGKGAY